MSCSTTSRFYRGHQVGQAGRVDVLLPVQADHEVAARLDAEALGHVGAVDPVAVVGEHLLLGRARLDDGVGLEPLVEQERRACSV